MHKIEYPFFFHHKEPGLFFFRLLGWGLHIKDSRKHRLSFSDRNGFTHKIGPYYWKTLTP